MASTRVDRIISRWMDGKGQLGTLFNLWDDISRLMHPSRYGFSSEVSIGDRRTQDMFDGTPALAVKQLRANAVSLTVPKSQQWGKAKAADEALDDQQPVRIWFDEANRRTHEAIYLAQAGFRAGTDEAFDDLVSFGQSCTWHAEATTRTHQVFKTIHLKNVVTLQNADGRIDTVYVFMPMTIAQAVGRGLPLSDSASKSFEEGKLETKVQYLNCVMPAGLEPDGRRIGGAPFISIMIELTDKKIISEQNVQEMPYHTPRWDTIAGGEPWSPGRLALPDAGTLNAMTRTLLKAGQLQVTPPILTPDARSINMVRLVPGGPVPYDIEQAKSIGRIPVQPFNTGANIPLGEGMAQERREMIWAIFLRNVLNLPVDSPQMTATEVVQRRDEMLRIVEPTFGRLETEYSAPVFTRAFGIELRAGRLTVGNPLPPELSNAAIDYEFSSPIQRVREMVDALQSVAMMEQLGPLGAVDPGIYDNLDTDEISRDVMEAFGPSKWLKPIEVVAQIREQRRIQAQQQQIQEQLAQMAQAAPETAERVIDGVAREVLPAA
ncbi:MAG: portal protein [Geminicoccaceae bacterium]